MILDDNFSDERGHRFHVRDVVLITTDSGLNKNRASAGFGDYFLAGAITGELFDNGNGTTFLLYDLSHWGRLVMPTVCSRSFERCERMLKDFQDIIETKVFDNLTSQQYAEFFALKQLEQDQFNARVKERIEIRERGLQAKKAKKMRKLEVQKNEA